MRTKQLRALWTRWTPILALVPALLAPPLLADGEVADCGDVSLKTESGLALGTVRTLPDHRGFLELHPRHGISVSNDGVVHQGPWGSAELSLSGPRGIAFPWNWLCSRSRNITRRAFDCQSSSWSTGAGVAVSTPAGRL